jgi:phosphoglycerate dehydrogenase-like enzyme
MEDIINVLVLVDFNDAIMDRLKTISPRLKFTRKNVKSLSDIPADLLESADIIYTNGILPAPESVPRVRWIQSHSAGIDNIIAQPLIADSDVIITTTSGIHASTIAEHSLAMMLALARKIPQHLRYQQKAEWPAERHIMYIPRELHGSTLGIVGYGAIGRELARIARAFGMDILATKRNVMTPTMKDKYFEPGTGDPEGKLVDRLYPPEATRSMMSLCDFVVITAPLTPGTKTLINADTLAAMKNTAFLVNIARGGVIDEEALIEALTNNTIAGAALDVFEVEPLPSSSPLWKLPNVIITPHIAGANERYHDLAADVFAQNLERYLSKRDLLNVVDRKYGY